MYILPSPEINISKSVLEKLKNELGEKDFEKLVAEITPKAADIIQKILEETSV